MNRHQLRLLSIALISAAAALFIHLGFQGWTVYRIMPFQNVGYLLLAVAILGILRINIWYGGPLDRRRDDAAPVTAPSHHVEPSIQRRWQDVQSSIGDWGRNWEAVPAGSGLQQELERELPAEHPLRHLAPIVFGRCRSCDDVVASVVRDTPVSVIHLTWRGRPEQKGWPSFLLLTLDQFVDRFLEQGEHS